MVDIIRWGSTGTYTDFYNEKNELVTSHLNYYADFEFINEDNMMGIEESKLRSIAAVAAMQGILAHWDDEFSYLCAEAYREDEKHTIPNGVAQFAVKCADSLIAELRRKDNQ